MSENAFWYGYLDAGEKSSPVLIDQRLNTGDAKTVYVYNLKRKAILEYRRELVESKLRELTPDEAHVAEQLAESFGEVRRGFRPRGARLANIPEKGRPRRSQEGDDDAFDDDLPEFAEEAALEEEEEE